MLLTVFVESESMNVEGIFSWTVFVAYWARESFSNQVLSFNVHSHRRRSVRCKITIIASPHSSTVSMQLSVDDFLHLI